MSYSKKSGRLPSESKLNKLETYYKRTFKVMRKRKETLDPFLANLQESSDETKMVCNKQRVKLS